MPSAVLNYLVASIYSPKKIIDNVASTIVVSTLMSFITLPIVVFCIKVFFLNETILLNLSAWIILPFMDAIAKYLSAELSFFQITWARYFYSLFYFPLMLIFFKKLTFSENPKLQLLRVLTLFLANICFFTQFQLFLWQKH